MTDRVKGVVVTLDADYRTDDVETILNALRMVKGVASVESVKADINDHINRMRVRLELQQKLFDVLNEKK